MVLPAFTNLSQRINTKRVFTLSLVASFFVAMLTMEGPLTGEQATSSERNLRVTEMLLVKSAVVLDEADLVAPLVATSSHEEKERINKRIEKYVTRYNYTQPAAWQGNKNGNGNALDGAPAVPAAAAECGTGPDYDAFFGQGEWVHSRHAEDKTIYTNFIHQQIVMNNGHRGTYVDVGAFDGMTESNTRFVDICLHWKGLLIEANPLTFAQAQKNRHQAQHMNFAPTCSQDPEGITEGTVEFHPATFSSEGMQDVPKPAVKVPCGPLGPVLEDVFQEEGGHINFISLDFKGGAHLVLETIDFERVEVDVILIKVGGGSCKTTASQPCDQREKVRSKMAQEGYMRYSGLIHESDLFVHSSWPYQLPWKISPDEA